MYVPPSYAQVLNSERQGWAQVRLLNTYIVKLQTWSRRIVADMAAKDAMLVAKDAELANFKTELEATERSMGIMQTKLERELDATRVEMLAKRNECERLRELCRLMGVDSELDGVAG